MKSKPDVREAVWAALREARAARFPFPLRHRIPNFVGAERAAERLCADPAYRQAQVLKVNPDSPQLPLRRRALRDGKVVVMAVPRLRAERCFLRLDPARIAEGDRAQAATISGAARFGEALRPEQVPPVHLVVAGSVAVRADGARVGKGGGYADLEFALLRELGAVGPQTPIVTTVHDLQVVQARWPIAPYDIPLTAIFTPTRTLACEPGQERPPGILWEALDADMRDAIPVLTDWPR